MEKPNLALLDEEAAARILGAKVATLRKWRWAGTGPRYTKLGKLVRYRLSDIEQFVDSGTVLPRAER